MLISVNICLYNSTKYIQETLESVFAQTYQDFEIIAIDDGSTDGTYEFIREKYQDPRLKLYRQENHGLAFTRNKCLEYSTGEYIAFLDHDDIWMPDKLKLQMDLVHKAKEKPYIVFGDSIIIDNKGIEKYREGEIARNKCRISDDLFETFMREGCICGLSSVIVRRDAFTDNIRFDKFKVAEEFDVWLKIAYVHATEFSFITEIVYKYRIHDKSATLLNYENMFKEALELYTGWLGKIEQVELRNKCLRKISETKSKYAHWLLKIGRKTEAFNNIRDSLAADRYNIGSWISYIKFHIKYLNKLSRDN